jgi:putative phosphoesterase
VIIGLIADPHANAYGVRAALAALQTAGAVEIVCAGDTVGYHLLVNEAIDDLRAARVQAVLGNHDAMLLGRLAVGRDRFADYGLEYAAGVITAGNREWLARCPERLDLERDGLRVTVVHGSPWAPLTDYVYPDDPHFERFADVDADLVVLGHTHRPFVRRVASRTVVNPGSCGLPRDGLGGAAFALFDTASGDVSLERVSYDESRVSSPFLDALRGR